MAYIKEAGLYRCRLQLDPETNHPCIDVSEHYAWDEKNRCFNPNLSEGGLQIVLRADAYRVLDNGELSTTREEINMDNRGVTIITKRQYGEEVIQSVVANFVRIFGLRDASELLSISTVNPQQLAEAVFDCRASTYQKRDGKTGLNYWFAPVGEAEFKSRPFTPTKNKSTLDKFRAKLRVECKDIVTTASAPAPEAKMPAPAPKATKSPTAPKSSLPPRADAEPTPSLDLNKVWDMWIRANPSDIHGGEFYQRLSSMFGESREASSLNPYELSAFCKANGLSVGADDDDENPPF